MRSIFRRDGMVLVILMALTAVMTNPLVFHLTTAVEDKMDGLLNTWIIAWVGHALITDPVHLFDANIFSPYPNTLAFSEVMLPQGLLALPIRLASNNPVLGYNLVLLFSFFLAGYGMYLFLLDVTHRRGAGLIGGIIFAFNPFNLGNLAQIQLLSFGWLPLALLVLRRIIGAVPQSGHQSWIEDLRCAFLFAVLFSLQALSSIYYALLAGIAVALYVAWSLATRWVGRRTTPAGPAPIGLVRVVVRLALAAALIALLVVPFLLPYLQVERELGFQRTIEESESFNFLKLYGEVSPANVLYGRWLAPHPPVMIGNYPLDNLFPGLVALALAVLGIVRAKSRERWFYLLLVLVGFVLSLGPRLYITPTLSTDIQLPYRWLYDAVPLMHALRAPVRFDALVMLALAVLAGMGVATGRWGKGGWKAAGLAGVIVLEYLAVPAANITVVPTGANIPHFARWLAQQPPAVALELPMIASDPNAPPDLTPQYLSAFHWQRTPDGYSGFNPRPRGGIAYEMQFFPSERSISLLQALDVRYVIVHAAELRDWLTRREMIVQFADIKPSRIFGSDYIYQIQPRSPDPGRLHASVYLPNPAAPGQTYFAYLLIRNEGDHSFAIRPTDTLDVEARWVPLESKVANPEPARTTAVAQVLLPLVTSSVSIVQVRLTAPPQTGAYRLDLRTSSRALPAWNLSGDVSVEEGEPAHQVVLPAQVALRSPLSSEYKAGDTVQVDLEWKTLNKIDDYYSASVRIVDAVGNKVINDDRQPVTPTMYWVPGTGTEDRFALTLPANLPPGKYSVQILMYHADRGSVTQDALLLDDRYAPRDSVSFGPVIVK